MNIGSSLHVGSQVYSPYLPYEKAESPLWSQFWHAQHRCSHWSALWAPRKRFTPVKALLTTALSWIVLSIVRCCTFVFQQGLSNPTILFGVSVSYNRGLKHVSPVCIWCLTASISGMLFPGSAVWGSGIYPDTAARRIGLSYVNLMKAKAPVFIWASSNPVLCKILYKIIALTVALFILLLLGGCLCTTVCAAFGTTRPVGSNQQYGKLQLIYSDRHHYLYDCLALTSMSIFLLLTRKFSQALLKSEGPLLLTLVI